MATNFVGDVNPNYNFKIGELVPAVELPELVGFEGASYYLPETPEDMEFDNTTRILTGTPTRFKRDLYLYVAIKADGTSAFNYIPIFVYEDSANIDDRHNLILFKYPINYNSDNRNMAGTAGDINVPNIADNDYLTWAGQSRYVINTQRDASVEMPTDTDNTRITHIFIKSQGVNSFTINGGDSISIPSSVTSWEGKETRINLDGFQNYLHTLDAPLSANELILEFEPDMGIRIYEIMVLEEALSLDANGQFTEIIYTLSDRASILKEDLAERITKVPGVNNQRWTWTLKYNALFRSEQVNSLDEDIDAYNQLLNFMKDRDNDNFAISSEYTRYPDRVFPATFPDPDIQLNFISATFKGAGESVSFSVIEA